MYTKEQVKAAFWRRFRGAGELWFPYVGRDEEIDKSVDDVWQGMAQELDTAQRAPLFLVPSTHAGSAAACIAPSFKTLVVGIRRFQTKPLLNNNSRASLSTWMWPTMLRCPGVSPQRTPKAWQRLQSIGLVDFDAVDLLPPGGNIPEGDAVLQARYVQGVLSALDSVDLGYDLVVLLGGKVSNAFKSADVRLNEMRLLEYRNGCITIPSPHVVETDADGWWSNEAKLALMRGVVDRIRSGRCLRCINSVGGIGDCTTCEAGR